MTVRQHATRLSVRCSAPLSQLAASEPQSSKPFTNFGCGLKEATQTDRERKSEGQGH